MSEYNTNKIGCIYIIKNTINDKVYVGQTAIGAENRWKQHTKPSNIKKNNYALYRAMTKYGVDNFYYEILEDGIPLNELDEKEIYYIQKYNSYKEGYNSTKGGDGRIINKIEDIEYILEQVKKGIEIRQIAAELKVHPMTINRAIKAYGIDFELRSLKPKGLPSPNRQKVSRDDVKRLKEQGLSHAEIAKRLNINKRTVGRILKELNISERNLVDYSSLNLENVLKEYESKVINGEMRKVDFDNEHGFNQRSIKMIEKMYREKANKDNIDLKERVKYLYVQDHISDIIDLEKSGRTLVEISESYGVSVSAIRRLLFDAKYYIKDEINQSTLKKLWDKGLTNYEIADALGISKNLVMTTYKKMGLCKSRTPYTHRTDIDEDKMKEDYMSGMLVKDICQKYDIDKKTFTFFHSIDFAYYKTKNTEGNNDNNCWRI